MKTKIKFIVSILLSLCFNLTFSQIINGNITYISTSKLLETIKLDKENKDATQFIITMGQQINQNLKNIEFKLLFSKDMSLFQAIEKLSEDDVDGFAILTVGGSGSFYVNTTTKEKLHQIEAFGGRFLIQDNLNNTRWNLLNEKKVIKKYDCLKATTSKIVKNDKGIFKKEVIAWYTTEIPASFGPIGYGGLPGLILELDIENESNFLVKKIEINMGNKIVIKKPTKGKLVSKNEFELIGKQSDPWTRK